jgi:hypothetical protein
MSTDSLHPFVASFWQQSGTFWHLRQTNLLKDLHCVISMETRRTGEAKGDPPAYGRISRIGPCLPVTSSTGGTVEQLARFRPDALLQFVHEP